MTRVQEKRPTEQSHETLYRNGPPVRARSRATTRTMIFVEGGRASGESARGVGDDEEWGFIGVFASV